MPNLTKLSKHQGILSYTFHVFYNVFKCSLNFKVRVCRCTFFLHCISLIHSHFAFCQSKSEAHSRGVSPDDRRFVPSIYEDHSLICSVVNVSARPTLSSHTHTDKQTHTNAQKKNRESKAICNCHGSVFSLQMCIFGMHYVFRSQ